MTSLSQAHFALSMTISRIVVYLNFGTDSRNVGDIRASLTNHIPGFFVIGMPRVHLLRTPQNRYEHKRTLFRDSCLLTVWSTSDSLVGISQEPFTTMTLGGEYYGIMYHTS